MAGDDVVQYAADVLGQTHPLILVTFFTAVIVLYAIFVFFFYRYLAKQNIIGLNLRKYNRSANPGMAKFWGFILYIVEYIIILPIVTTFWFGILSVLLLTLTATEMSVIAVLMITTALIAGVRITAYISEKLSQDLAKMIPFTILAVAITSQNFFQISTYVERFSEIPDLVLLLPQFILFVIGVELIMRSIELIRKFIKYGDEINEEVELEE